MLQAFHNDQKIKDFYLTRLKMHRDADQLVHGIYWKNGKGCAIGCTLHSNKHEDFETVLGLPEWFARLFEFLFESQKNSKAKDFPIQALEAIPIGADLQKTYHKFCVFLLEEIIQFDIEKFPQVKKAIDDIIQLHKIVIDEDVVREEERSAAESAARSAAESAWSAAWSAARSAESAAWSAESAESAESAARSAESAAQSAESAAWSAESAESAESAARSAESAAQSAESAESAAIEKIADKLIELLKEAQPIT